MNGSLIGSMVQCMVHQMVQKTVQWFNKQFTHPASGSRIPLLVQWFNEWFNGSINGSRIPLLVQGFNKLAHPQPWIPDPRIQIFFPETVKFVFFSVFFYFFGSGIGFGGSR